MIGHQDHTIRESKTVGTNRNKRIGLAISQKLYYGAKNQSD